MEPYVLMNLIMSLLSSHIPRLWFISFNAHHDDAVDVRTTPPPPHPTKTHPNVHKSMMTSLLTLSMQSMSPPPQNTPTLSMQSMWTFFFSRHLRAASLFCSLRRYLRASCSVLTLVVTCEERTVAIWRTGVAIGGVADVTLGLGLALLTPSCTKPNWLFWFPWTHFPSALVASVCWMTWNDFASISRDSARLFVRKNPRSEPAQASSNLFCTVYVIGDKTLQVE